jgi:predicted Rossmann fold nucleotide-binding protein DprA/Smf involved in DNA uptake
LSDIVKQQIVAKKTCKEESKIEEEFDEETKKVLNIIIAEPNGVHIDKLQNVSKLEITKLMNILFSLVVNGKIKELPGKIYLPVND